MYQLEKNILHLMCEHSAKALKLQCGCEYGFADEGQEARATDLTLLTREELKDLQTNNLIYKCWLAHFGKRSVVGKF